MNRLEKIRDMVQARNLLREYESTITRLQAEQAQCNIDAQKQMRERCITVVSSRRWTDRMALGVQKILLSDLRGIKIEGE